MSFVSVSFLNLLRENFPKILIFVLCIVGGAAGMKMGVSSQEIRGLVGNAAQPQLRDPYGPPYYPREPTESLGSATTSSQDPIYSDPLAKVRTQVR